MAYAPELEPTPAEKPAELYELDYDFVDVELIVGDKKKKRLTHRLRKPTFEELHRRFQLVVNEEINQSDGETEPIYNDEKANVYLYDALVQGVQNYRLPSNDAEGWTYSADEIRKMMPTPHKSKAIAGMYISSAALIEETEDDGMFPLIGAAEIGIELEIAEQFKTRHFLQAPTEAQWSALQSKRVQTRQKRGEKRPHFSYQINIAPARDFYDQLLVRMEGVKLRSGAEFSSTDRQSFVANLDALFKQMVVNEFCDYWGGRLRD